MGSEGSGSDSGGKPRRIALGKTIQDEPVASPSPLEDKPHGGETILDRDGATQPASRQILRLLGQGGMGSVHLALDTQLHRHVAIKFLLPDLVNQQRALDRFRSEAFSIAALAHHHIVRIYTFDASANPPFIEMEYIAGPAPSQDGEWDAGLPNPPLTLDQYVRRQGTLGVEEVLVIAGKLLGAMSYAHRKRVIHRDIKPANIMLDEMHEPKLVDFGLARDMNVDGRTQTGVVLGTLDYMAPEQETDAASVDERADLYSIGATLFFALTGDSPRYFRESRVPERLRPALLRALERDRDERFASADEFAEALGMHRSGSASGFMNPSFGGGAVVPCPQCSAENQFDVDFCQKCGASLAQLFRKCPACGRKNRADATFCGGCGANLKHAVNQPSAAIPSPSPPAVVTRDNARELLREAETAHRAREIIRLMAIIAEFGDPGEPGSAASKGMPPDILRLHQIARDSMKEAESHYKRAVLHLNKGDYTTCMMECVNGLKIVADHAGLQTLFKEAKARLARGTGIQSAALRQPPPPPPIRTPPPAAATQKPAPAIKQLPKMALPEKRQRGPVKILIGMILLCALVAIIAVAWTGFIDYSAWEDARQADTEVAYGKYITERPTGQYRAQADARLDALVQRRRSESTRFDHAQRQETGASPAVALATWQAFIRDYPNSPHRPLAEEQILHWEGITTAQAAEVSRLLDRIAQQYARLDLEGALETASELLELQPDHEPTRKLVEEMRGMQAQQKELRAATGAGEEKEMETGLKPAETSVSDALVLPANPRLGDEQVIAFAEGVTMTVVYIPPGIFSLGSPSSRESKYEHDERPVTRVELSVGFWMGKTEVTQAQWYIIMKENPSYFGAADRPVEMVSWRDAMEYCDKLTTRFGRRFSLPTEAQWEYACRAGTTTHYYFGGNVGPATLHAWYSGNANRGTHPVGEKLSNPWGLHDMTGNAAEWCYDVKMDYPGGAYPDYVALQGGRERVVRGGAWDSRVENLRSASRDYYDSKIRRNTIGFRIVCEE